MGNPFDSSPFAETTKEQPVERGGTVNDAKNLLDAALNLNAQAAFARKTKNREWLERLRGLAIKLMAILWDFVKKALMIAIFNFILEVCNQVLNSATSGLSKYKTAPAPSQSQNYGDPFSRHYGSGGGVGW